MALMDPPISSAAPDAAVALSGVSKAFGAAPAVLTDVSLTLRRGAFTAIVGRSGSGKSTLLRLLVGLEPPTAGTVQADFAGARIVFQEPRLLPWAKVLENVRVGLGPAADKPEARRAAELALREVGLAGREGAWPAELSGGQRQRVALARALVSKPSLLALDEPFGALDALTRIEMQELVEAVWRQQGFTAALVTHDVAEAVRLGDRVLLIDQGGVALDLAIDLPRPRRPGDAALAQLERQILDRLFGR